MNSSLLPIGTVVYHSGHGKGEIVSYNGVQANSYVEQNLDSPVVAELVEVGLGQAIVSGFYSGSRYPYVVQFEPSDTLKDRFPNGYKDVYDVDGVVMKVLA